jgi:hypothetical protein
MVCSGFIQYEPSPNYLQVVGGEQEQEKHIYAQGDYVYVNAGSRQGMRLGNEYTVVRPRGRFTSHWTKKRGALGVYTQEVGQLRVIVVKDEASVALITSACDAILLGDLLRAAEQRKSPPARVEAPLNRFSDPSGKQQGRIVLARDAREMVTKDHIVFIDLGTEDNIKPGDYLTIYRQVGKGNLTNLGDEEITHSGLRGFESDRYRGGKFSVQAQRVQDPTTMDVEGQNVTTPEVRRRRPALPRKVLGEMVVIGVQKRTATAVITRIAQEIHTGDHVELQ